MNRSACPVYDTRQSGNLTELSENLKQAMILNVNHQLANSSMNDADLHNDEDEDSGSNSINNMTFTISSDDLPVANSCHKDSPSTLHPPGIQFIHMLFAKLFETVGGSNKQASGNGFTLVYDVSHFTLFA
jgi:hypothetical protein